MRGFWIGKWLTVPRSTRRPTVNMLGIGHVRSSYVGSNPRRADRRPVSPHFRKELTVEADPKIDAAPDSLGFGPCRPDAMLSIASGRLYKFVTVTVSDARAGISRGRIGSLTRHMAHGWAHHAAAFASPCRPTGSCGERCVRQASICPATISMKPQHSLAVRRLDVNHVVGQSVVYPPMIGDGPQGLPPGLHPYRQSGQRR